MACGETKGIQRGDVVVDSKLRPSVRCVCVLWMVEYSVLVCNSARRAESRSSDECVVAEVRDDARPESRRKGGLAGRAAVTPTITTYRYARKSPTNSLRDSDEPSRLKTFEKNHGCTDELIRDRESNP